ncbi:MAG: diguanylate cyclase [Myxococcaceae bacterium]|nr:diguanylate cyclase [Myxococcaceae bacterium]MCI0672313.1 diguanylate cyclase [Myxococcaceae bacterium]
MTRILLVDDEKVARALYGDYLTAAGHSVVAVGSLSAAKAAIAQTPFDAVVTDLILPEGDGMEVLRHVKEQHPGVEVVVITALDKVDPAVRAIKSGAAEYLVKPVAPEALQHAVARALTSRQLLRENESLRHHLMLLEHGQRIATTLDREHLLPVVSGAFTAVTGACAVLVYARQGETAKLLGGEGLSPEELAPLDTVLAPRLSGNTAPLALDGLPGPCPFGLLVPAADADGIRGWAVLLFDAVPRADAVPSAGFLAKHLALGLRNLGRFAEVEDLAYLDDLTHLFNTRYLHLVLDREVTSAQASEGVFSLLFLDLDYFKSINDTHGHLVGSKLLVEVARVLKGCVRDNDVVVRYGGDEYVILLRSTDSGGALKVAERIRRTMETHHFLAREGLALTVTTCIGVASFPEHATDKATLLDWADRAMYRGKKGSRNVVYMAALGLEATPPARHSTPTG